MKTAFKIIGIPIYIVALSLLIYPLFNIELSLFGHMAIVIPVILTAYWQVFFFKNNEK